MPGGKNRRSRGEITRQCRPERRRSGYLHLDGELQQRGEVLLGFRNFSICQIWREISRNFTEISVQLKFEIESV